jgi:hypothetical protein
MEAAVGEQTRDRAPRVMRLKNALQPELEGAGAGFLDAAPIAFFLALSTEGIALDWVLERHLGALLHFALAADRRGLNETNMRRWLERARELATAV